MLGIIGKVLSIVQFLPSLITGIESIFGPKTGQQKQAAAVGVVGQIITASELVSGKDIIDANAFQEGLKQVIDGMVKMLNASVWKKTG